MAHKTSKDLFTNKKLAKEFFEELDEDAKTRDNTPDSKPPNSTTTSSRLNKATGVAESAAAQESGGQTEIAATAKVEKVEVTQASQAGKAQDADNTDTNDKAENHMVEDDNDEDWETDESSDDDDYGYDDYDEPELFMGDPRDREIAEILYGPGAGYNPAYFSSHY